MHSRGKCTNRERSPWLTLPWFILGPSSHTIGCSHTYRCWCSSLPEKVWSVHFFFVKQLFFGHRSDLHICIQQHITYMKEQILIRGLWSPLIAWRLYGLWISGILDNWDLFYKRTTSFRWSCSSFHPHSHPTYPCQSLPCGKGCS